LAFARWRRHSRFGKLDAARRVIAKPWCI
jgi:hypothetical protein